LQLSIYINTRKIMFVFLPAVYHFGQ